MSSRRKAPANSASRWQESRWAIFSVPALLAILLTLQSVQGPLVWDDSILITDDKFVHHLSNIPAAFGRSFWAGVSASKGFFDYYRPLTTATYMLNYAVGDTWSGPYHLVNIALYGATAGLVALAVSALGGAGGVALASGLLFAAWPTHHENVNFVSGRPDLLVGLFLLLAFAALRRAREPLAHPKWLVALGLCVAGAAFSKEVAYLAPAAILLYEWAAGWRWSALVRAGVAAAPVAVAASLRHVVLAHRIRAPLPSPALILGALLSNVRTLVFPWPLHVNRFVPDTWAHPHWTLVGGCAAFFALTLWTCRSRAERAAWLAGWFFLLPGCLTGIPADRMLYLPTVFLLPWAAERFSRLPWPGATRAALCMAAVTLLGTGLVARGSIWNSERRVFESQVQESPWDPVAHDHLANVYHHQADTLAAADTARTRWLTMSRDHSRMSVLLDSTKASSYFDYARTLMELDQDSLALLMARQGLRREEDSKARFVEAQSLAKMKRWAEADTAVSRGLRSSAGRADGTLWATLGWIRYQQGRCAEAAGFAARAVAVDSTLLFARYNRALALGCEGQADSADAIYRGGLRRDRNGAAAAIALGDLCDHAQAGRAHGRDLIRIFLRAAGDDSTGVLALTPAARAALGPARQRALSVLSGIR